MRFSPEYQKTVLGTVPYTNGEEGCKRLARALDRLAVASPADPSPSWGTAGWLTGDCEGVFIAHSLAAAIHGLRQTIPDDLLPRSYWTQALAAASQLHQQFANSSSHDRSQSPQNALERQPSDVDCPPAKRPRLAALHTEHARTTERSMSPGLADALIELAERADHSSPESDGMPADQRGMPQDSRASSAAPSVSDPRATVQTSVTNNHRRRERRRKARLAAIAATVIRECSLERPPDTASVREMLAYRSIQPDEETILSWLLGQEYRAQGRASTRLGAGKEPYVKATSMLRNARLVGKPSVQPQIKSFLKAWRERGAPFSRPGRGGPLHSYDVVPDRSIASALSTPQGTQSGGSNLSQAWSMISTYDEHIQAVHIQYRWAMVTLAQAWNDEYEKQRDKKSGPERPGDIILTRLATTELLKQIYPRDSIEEHRSAFTNRLYRGRRWHAAVKKLGWGILCLIPNEDISNTWIESTLSSGEWRLWLDLVEKVNEAASESTRVFEESFKMTPEGEGTIPEGILLIELEYNESEQPSSSRVEELEDGIETSLQNVQNNILNQEESSSQDGNIDVARPAPLKISDYFKQAPIKG